MVDGGREKGRRGELAHDASSAVQLLCFVIPCSCLMFLLVIFAVNWGKGLLHIRVWKEWGREHLDDCGSLPNSRLNM